MNPACCAVRISPFGGATGRYYLGPTHEEAFSRLLFLWEQQRRLGLLMGPSGSGKTLLLRQFARHVRRRGAPGAMLSLIGLEPGEALARIGADFALALSPTDSLPRLWCAIEERLAAYAYEQASVVILCDDADQASASVIEHVQRLVVSAQPESRLTVVLSGRLEHIGRVGRRLLDSADLRIDLPPWTRDETAAMMSEFLSAEPNGCPRFSPQAVDRLHALSRGLPRRICHLADMALVVARGRGGAEIGPDLIDLVHDELSLTEG